MKKLYNTVINMIEIMMHKYYNKITKFIKQNLYQKILINMQIKNNDFHKHKLQIYLNNQFK